MDLQKDCFLKRIASPLPSETFDCGVVRLNNFLHKESVSFSEKLLGVSYVFLKEKKKKEEVVAFFTVSNDAIHVKQLPNNSKNKVNKKVPSTKHMKGYPAVKIGQLGVSKDYRGFDPRVGHQLMKFIKGFFLKDNKTGCKFILVDATNNEKVKQYYASEGFEYLFESEEQEAAYERRKTPLGTRAMFYDLGKLIEQ